MLPLGGRAGGFVAYDYSSEKIIYKELAEKLIGTFTLRLGLDSNGAKRRQNINRQNIEYIAGFLIRLLFCVSKLTNTKHLLVVDNIETFLPNDSENKIQDESLETIILGCHDATISVRNIMLIYQQLPGYKTFYGLLLVMRDTTASTALASVQHLNEFERNNEIDISEWYCTDDILERKKSYIKRKGIHVTYDCYMEAYKTILHDISIYRWGMHGILLKMYRNSHRIIGECVSKTIGLMPEDEIGSFNEVWHFAQTQSNNNTQLVKSLKYLSRKYAIRKFLDYANRKHYFAKTLIDAEENQDNAGCNTYARKLVNLLSRFSMANSEYEYISFPRIINTLIKKPHMPDLPTKTQIQKLCDIMFWMNETRHDMTNWMSLISIRYPNDIVYSKENLFKVVYNQWNSCFVDNHLFEISDNTSDYGVKITNAGLFLAKILPDFEFFACRYCGKYPPLLSKASFNRFNPEGEESFIAIESIKNVRRKAERCVDEIIRKDKEFYTSAKTMATSKNELLVMYNDEYSCLYKENQHERARTHPYRILTQHIDYLSHYKTYVEQYISDGDFSKVGDKQRFLELLALQKRLYKKKLAGVMKDNPDYFPNSLVDQGIN